MSDYPAPPAPQPPAPGPPGGPGQSAAVTVPHWLATDWSGAAVVAAAAVGSLFVLGIIAVVASLAIDFIAIGETWLTFKGAVGAVLMQPLTHLGAQSGAPVTLTGVVLFAATAYRVARSVGAEAFRDDHVRLAAFGGKVALVSVAVMLAAGIVVDILDVGSVGLRNSLTSGFGVDYVRLVFLTGPLLAVVGYLAAAMASGTDLLGLVGARVPPVVASSWVGTRKTLTIALLGLAPLYFVGLTLEVLTDDFGELRFLVSRLLSLALFTIIMVLVDFSTLMFVTAMSFLRFGDLGDSASWEWASVLLVAAAFFVGGRAAAKAAEPKTMAEAVVAASLVGVIISVIAIPVSISYQGFGSVDDFAVHAIFLPLLWTIPAVLGAWVYANQENLPGGVAVSVAPAAAAPEGPNASAAGADTEAPAASASAAAPAEGRWASDPTGRHELRWWDGRRWTDHVADGDVTGSDPVS